MNNENFHPRLKEPPIAHALHKWDEKTRTLSYEYNGGPLINIYIPGTGEVGFRHGSDGNIQNMPFFQNIYVMVDNPVKAKAVFYLSSDAVNMRPGRAGNEDAILGQVGRPLMFGVNGLYDITQDLLVEWNGCTWKWLNNIFGTDGNGNLVAEMEVELGPKPWMIILRMHYYRTHLGYSYHKPWEWRPNMKSVAGWCSWEACRRNAALPDIESFSEFFSENLKDYGLEYIQLDDGYENLPIPADKNKTLAEGWLEPNEKFPGGHTGIIETIKKYGFEPAIWTNTNVTNKEFAQKNRECFVEDRKGKLLLGEWIDYILDCTEDTLKRHVYSYYKGLSDYGYTYFKTDSIRHLIMDGLHEAVRQGVMTNTDAEVRFRRFLEYARKGIGNEKYFLASWGVLSEAVGMVDACRIAMDANPTWAGIRMQMVESARWFHTQRILFLNDPDHICARTNIEWLKSLVSLVSLSGSLFMLSDPLECYDNERLSIIKRNLPTLKTIAGETGLLDMSYPAFTWTKLHGFAVHSKEKPVEAEDVSLKDAMYMAGIYPTMHNNHPLSTLWSFHINTPGRKWCIAGRFATVPLEESFVALENLGLNPVDEYAVFDFWEQKYLGRVTGEIFCKKLELGYCQVISLSRLAGYPQLIASSRHVSMDAVSVKNHIWCKNKLSLDIAGVVGTTETYWFHVEKSFFIKTVIINEKTHTWERNGELAKIEIPFTVVKNHIDLIFENKT